MPLVIELRDADLLLLAVGALFFLTGWSNLGLWIMIGVGLNQRHGWIDTRFPGDLRYVVERFQPLWDPSAAR